jgi:ribonuclease P protein component
MCESGRLRRRELELGVKKRVRLTRQADFQRVLGGRRVYGGRTLLAFAEPNREETTRVGVAVSRRVRDAVDRNRIRRRLREAARRARERDWGEPPLGRSFDVVLIGRPAALGAPWGVVEAEVGAALTRLSGR